MKADGISFNTEEMKPPHHVPADSDFVKTLLSAYEKYSGRKGECIAIGGGTYVHNLKNGVAFGAALPETENHMHGPDEFAVVDELTMSAKIFAQVIWTFAVKSLRDRAYESGLASEMRSGRL